MELTTNRIKWLTMIAATCGTAAVSAQELPTNPPAPSSSLLQAQQRAASLEEQVDVLRNEVSVLQAQLERERVKKELSVFMGVSGLPSVIATATIAGKASALVLDENGAQRWIKKGEKLHSGHVVTSITSEAVEVRKGAQTTPLAFATRQSMLQLSNAAPGMNGPMPMMPNMPVMPPSAFPR